MINTDSAFFAIAFALFSSIANVTERDFRRIVEASGKSSCEE